MVNLDDATGRYLLAIVPPGDENNYLLREFINSLGDGAKRVFESFGYLGKLEDANNRDEWDKKHFFIYRGYGFSEASRRYFYETVGAAAFEISDDLAVKVRYKEHKENPTSFFVPKEWTYEEKGGIDQIIGAYNRFSSMNTKELLNFALGHSEFVQKEMIRRKWYLDRIVVKTLIATGLETADEKYLLGITEVKAFSEPVVDSYNRIL